VFDAVTRREIALVIGSDGVGHLRTGRSSFKLVAFMDISRDRWDLKL